MASISLPGVASTDRTVSRPSAKDVVGPVLAAIALVVWFFGVQDADYLAMNDIGLISILPVPVLLAMVTLTLCFLFELHRTPIRTLVALFYVVVLIVMLFGVTALIEPVPRFESAWKHVGVTDYIMRTGEVDPGIDVYFNWPGFFILVGFITEVVGLKSPMSLLSWAPVAFNLLYLGPLLMLFRRGTSDRRLTWLGIWVFYVANWVGQDYLAPQAFGYFIYLTILGILVTWLPGPTFSPEILVERMRRLRLATPRIERLVSWLAVPDLPAPTINRRQQLALAGAIVLLYAAVVPSHQLTPIAILGSVTVLAVANRCSVRLLPLIMLVLVAWWLRNMASAYFASHGTQVAEQVGSVDSSVTSNLGDRLSGSPGHLIVVYLRSTASLIIWGLAGLGFMRRLRNHSQDFTYALLAAAPFPLLALQSYGGEMLLRIYLFALPFMVFFVAALFIPSPTRGYSWLSRLSMSLMVLLLLSSFFFTRYGNERMDVFTPAEVQATTFLYDNAPPGSLLLAGTPKTPWKHRNYEQYKHRALSADVEWDWDADLPTDVALIAASMHGSQYPASYLFITRSQIANDEMFELLPYRLDDIVAAVSASDRFKVIYENEDAIIFVLIPLSPEGWP